MLTDHSFGGLNLVHVNYYLHTHSVTVLEDFSRLKASWYLRLSTSFFICGRSISSMVAVGWCTFLPVHKQEAPRQTGRQISATAPCSKNTTQLYQIYNCSSGRTVITRTNWRTRSRCQNCQIHLATDDMFSCLLHCSWLPVPTLACM